MSPLYAASAVSSFASFGVFLLVAMVLGGRSDADRSTKRPFAVYLGSVLFLVVFGLLIAATIAALPFTDRIGKSNNDFSARPGIHTAFRTLLIVLIVAIPLGVLFVSHWRSRERMRAESDFVGSAHARTDRVFVYACCFTSVLIMTVTFAVFLIQVLQLLFPSFMSDQSAARTSASRTALALVLPMFGSAMIFNTFWGQAHDDRDAVAAPIHEPTTL